MSYIFGKTKAAIALADMVKDNNSARRFISSLLSEFSHQMMTIVLAREPKTVIICLKLLRDYTISRVNANKYLPDKIKSFTKNVIVYRHRAFKRGFEYVVKHHRPKLSS